jgi:DNA-directed RNA polymerase sigma subunit (sigma70/sigma32)
MGVKEGRVPTPKTQLRLVLTEVERSTLQTTARSTAVEHGHVIRARLILLLAEGYTLSEVGRRVGLQRRIVRKWAQRFERKRLKGLEDAPRSGRPARFSPRSSAAPGEAGMRAA